MPLIKQLFINQVILVLIYLIARSNCEVDLNVDIDKLNQEKIVQMVIIIARHGQRTAGDATYPGDLVRKRFLEIWPEGMLQLTNKGKMEQYELGQWIRQRYETLLGDYYSSESSFALSTNTDRSMMSVMCVMAGLFPPRDNQIWNQKLLWQPVPVHAYGKTAGNLLNVYGWIQCPKYWKEFNQVLKSEEYLQIWNSYRELRDYIYNETASEMNDYRSIAYLFDYIDTQAHWNLTIPQWAQAIYPEPLYTAATHYFTVPTFNDQLKRLFMGPLLKEIIQQFETKIAGKSERTLYFLSGHDDNISNLLNLLGVFNNLIPPFSSAVILELRKDSTTDNHYVTVFYKNSTLSPYLLKVAGCQSVCRLETFKAALDPYIPENWEEECSITDAGIHIKSAAVITLFLFILVNLMK